jgi:hypothetical protein
MENRRRSLRASTCAGHPPLAQCCNPLLPRGSGRRAVQNLDNVPEVRSRPAARPASSQISTTSGGRWELDRSSNLQAPQITWQVINMEEVTLAAGFGAMACWSRKRARRSARNQDPAAHKRR